MHPWDKELRLVNDSQWEARGNVTGLKAALYKDLELETPALGGVI